MSARILVKAAYEYYQCHRYNPALHFTELRTLNVFIIAAIIR